MFKGVWGKVNHILIIIIIISFWLPMKLFKVSPGLEPGLSDSKSEVLTTTLQDQWVPSLGGTVYTMMLSLNTFSHNYINLVY